VPMPQPKILVHETATASANVIHHHRGNTVHRRPTEMSLRKALPITH
jgi:hypothetical protein